MKNLKNITHFDDFLKEKLTWKSVKDLLIKPLPTEILELEEDKAETDKPFTIYLSKDKQLKKDEITSVTYLYSEIKENSPTDYDLIIVVEERGKEATIRFDIFDKKMFFTRKGSISVTFLASTNKEGASVIYQVLKDEIIENQLDKLSNIKLTDIPISL